MPYKDPEKLREYTKVKGRKWYEEHRQLTIERVAKRKRDEYGSNCVICGKRIGNDTKNGPKRRFCKDHRKELWEDKMHTEEQRRIWREQKRESRKRIKEGGRIKAATPREPTSKQLSVAKNTQEVLAGATHKGLAFSRLKHTVDRDQDEKNGSPPPPRQWASP